MMKLGFYAVQMLDNRLAVVMVALRRVHRENMCVRVFLVEM